MLDYDKYINDTAQTITRIFMNELNWEQDRVFGMGKMAVMTEKKLGDIVATLIHSGIGDIDAIADVWSRYATDVARERDVAKRVVKEFAAQVGCVRCPYKGRCDITNADPRNNYEDCYKKILELAQQDLEEERK